MLKHYYSTTAPEILLNNPANLAVITFSRPCAPATPGLIQTGITSLPEEGVSEVWETENSTLVRGSTGRCHWSKTDKILCAAIWITPEECHDLEAATHSAYDELLSLIKDSQYPHPFRFWNYIPRINEGDGDREAYKQFCNGRLKAFQQQRFPSCAFPAASALGHDTAGAVFYVFALKTPGKQFENPLQEKAYCYPRQYGPSSPSFSRATAVFPSASALFISGTASIVGHQTTHLNEIEGQVKTTLANIDNLLVHAGHSSHTLKSLKVYIRDEHNLEPVRRLVSAHYAGVTTLYTRADICRRDLLVEIEAHCEQ